MMKQIFTTLAVSATLFMNAQLNITLDNNFGNNGIVRIPLQGTGYDLHIMESQDHKILAYGYENSWNDANSIKRLYKFNLDGSADTTFGNKGVVILPNYLSYFNVALQGDKILVYYQQESGSNTNHIIRYNSDGTVDTSFGNVGQVAHVNLSGNSSGGFLDNQLVVMGDNSILFTNGGEFVKLTSDGQPDSSYGTSGVTISPTNNWDIQLAGNNLISSKYQSINKIDLAGNPISSFGNNGVFTYNSNDDYVLKQSASGDILSMGISSGKFYKISSVGTQISTISLPADNENHDFVQFGNYTVFTGINSTAVKPFLLFYDANNSLQTVNGQNSYNENISAVYNSLLGLNGGLFTSGFEVAGNSQNYVIAKYISTTLGTSETQIKTFIRFENPATTTLNFESKDAVSKIELYSADGQLVKVLHRNHESIATLAKGVYISKTTFANGKTAVTKIVKQ